ncbi:DNA REPAIR PROTEIN COMPLEMENTING XP-G CELLS-RELATED [Salix koriyanagi]|uniref:DNA REPAIR PROTEIN COMPLEMENTING XP-G CELLS-RELATED n=1 Tax=Salix koriyanagi TaxID=2511006 RepID=A0A9Q0SVM4_9ROSI|nr:DNA REPAIR PROTEIN COMPLEMENTING XP-G CELLS-RELATED [Salix koriyanagi]
MGVQWDLLASVGRRVAVETLADKKLAIDASIWLVQFIKAMRDDKGDGTERSSTLLLSADLLRENARAKIRKTDENLLLNQLKSMRLKELAKDLEKQNAANKKGKQTKILEENKRVPGKLDEMLAASIAAEECGSLNNNASTSVAVAAVEEGDSDGDEEMILFENQSEKHKNNTKGKEILSDHTDIEGSNMGRDHMAAESYN